MVQATDRHNKKEVKDELVEKLVHVNRVAKTVKGGRTMSFAAVVVVGDQKGRIGLGTGKAAEVPEAVVKATNEARKNMIRIPLREGRTLHHDVHGRFGAGKVVLRTAPAGTGVIAGGPMRAVFEVLGVQDVVAKSLGSNNPYNMIKATFDALKAINSPRMVATKRGKKVGDIVSRRENTANAKMEKEEA
jgi:small subunit ribosomal protein S5